MNWDHFSQWFEEKLLVGLDRPTVIVLDQASYHMKRVPGSSRPTTSDKKTYIQEWLTGKGIQFDVS